MLKRLNECERLVFLSFFFFFFKFPLKGFGLAEKGKWKNAGYECDGAA